ncbi:unnamed protein product [Phytophthora fragariaefolia]|uniref:Unnamed protein product n=1 Tax=Phytophthora fragariaefolia TaxID=1490495 RepID=A0A9W6Y443_9STRA|nr:unnamed protein product [Phytophthora fragariaefolia]
MGQSKTEPGFGQVPFVLDAADLTTAQSFGLLDDDAPVNMTDSTSPLYGVAHIKTNLNNNKLFNNDARISHIPFLLIVHGSSSANAKNMCKRRHNMRRHFLHTWYRGCLQFRPTDLLPHRAAGFHGVFLSPRSSPSSENMK